MIKDITTYLFIMLFINACTISKQPDIMTSDNIQLSNTQQYNKIQQTNETFTKEFRITAKAFEFIPETIEVDKGDNVRLIITSVDVAHGYAIPDYGINIRINPGENAIIEFTADKEGIFTSYCSVSCGQNHSKMKGKLIVK